MTSQFYLFLANLRTFGKKHHAILFILLLALILAVAIFSLYRALTVAFEKPVETSSSIQGFDQKTVVRIKNLHNSNDSSSSSLVLPSPRSNPFSE